MKVQFKESFLKELKKLQNKKLKGSIYECIIQAEGAGKLSEIKNLKKLKGYNIYYRIRIGDYRIASRLKKK